MSEEILENRADYGCLPFDLFVSERWDHDASGDSQEQWERLVWEWQKLTLLERWPYQHRAESECSPPKISEEITRVLASHQTVHECNVSVVSSDGWQTVWLRTCYDLNLKSKYEEMKQSSNVPGLAVPEDKVLDDPTRYNFDNGSEDSWRQVLVRVPGLTDFGGIIDMDGDRSNMQYRSGQNNEYLVRHAEESEEDWRDVIRAQLKFQAGLYLLDREAIESGLIKILWLNEHGSIAWDNRLDPFTSDLEELAGALLNATSLAELANYDGTRGAMIER
ncbi:uncharacterized protein NFIA_032530 [Aspergillus fischeri NRRL 181]|uniref:Uncharacterized protein n=1 Tax=Neosartorya fischeri (strain ATCC 1020 / DSM 3700 / CBS 544.65 / FGSC A1164 / JCM 1740 / NRRL 181 / WB 181) TaxID=331117 RepID=A1CY69_NEOFI|nr:uncharacterized protein NFIA_032530 [Aspergillus fischeri NRRL 181]EAW23689.1 hypothetical protein NFIA_032530 [Aspergillus fischeri NRRL 181]KAG2026578.1 hypothetical protein GB937_001359 [Aspergillus fischeri]